MSIYCLLTKIGLDTAENESSEVSSTLMNLRGKWQCQAGLEGVDGIVNKAYSSMDGPGGLAQKFNQALEEKGNLIRTYPER